MKKTLDVWIIVPKRVPFPLLAVDGRHFTDKPQAVRYLRRGGKAHVDDHVILKATLTVEAE